MIHYITHNQLDRSKYDSCIENANSSRVYALSWYLDAVCETWDVLMTGDYDMVMPVPKRKKFGLNYVFTPAWSQQLGIFSARDITAEETEIFKRTLASKFHWIDYHFNSGNIVSDRKTVIKKNYVLSLKGQTEEIFQNYNKNRKRISSANFDHLFLDKEGDLDIFFKHYKATEKPYEIEDEVLRKLYTLALKNSERVHIWNVFDGGDFRGGLIWLQDTSRITYLMPVATGKGKKENVPTFIINELIKDHSNQELILDFEGSMIRGVANFYKSFGAVEENYYYFKKRFSNYG